MRFQTHTFRQFSGKSLLIVGMGLCVAAGCSHKYSESKVFMRAHQNEVAASGYRFEPPDRVFILSPTCPEINGEAQRIRADGKIALKLLGEVYISGMTPTEVETKLEQLLTEYYEEPRVSVRVASYSSKSIYIFGEVGNRGPMAFTGRDTLLDVLARAGLTNFAWGAQVKVIRPSPNDASRHEITIDVDKMMKTGDLKDNLLLQEGDIVFVPPTPLAWVGYRVQEVLFPVSPALSMYNVPYRAMQTTDEYRTYERPSRGDGDSGPGYRELLLAR